MASPAITTATGNRALSTGVTGFVPLGLGARLRSENTPEASMQLKYHTAGTFSKLFVYVITNAATTPGTIINFRKGGVTGASTITIPNLGTGLFEDLTHSDTIAVNDLVCLQCVGGGTGSTTWTQMGMWFTASGAYGGSTTWKLCADGTMSGLSTPSSVNYCYSNGACSPSTTEANAQVKMGDSWTAAFLSIYIATNTRSDASTFASRRNTAAGNQTMSIGASATGLFEDTTHTDAIVQGDLWNYVITLGAGSGTLGGAASMAWSCEMTGTNPSMMFQQSLATTAIAANLTRYTQPQGDFDDLDTTETNVQLKIRQPLIASYASCFVSANTVTASSTITMRKNAGAGNLLLTIGNGATGLFQDTTHSDSFVANDLMNWQIVTGATGTTLTLENIAFLVMETVVASSADTSQIQISEASTYTIKLPTADSAAIQVSESALTRQFNLAVNDSAALQISESSLQLLEKLTTSDTGVLQLSESALTLIANVSTSDTVQVILGTEVATVLQKIAAAGDSATIQIAESALTLALNISTADTAQVVIGSESTLLQMNLATSDSISLTAAELALFVSAIVSTSDSCGITINDSVRLLMALSTADTAQLQILETALSSVNVLSTLDNAAIQLSESLLTSQDTISTTDSITVQLVESILSAQAQVSTTDMISLTVQELALIASAVVQTADSLVIGINEAALLLAALVQTLDLLQIEITESALSLLIIPSGNLLTFTVSDSLALTIQEAVLTLIAHYPDKFVGRLPVNPQLLAKQGSWRIREGPFWR